MYSSANDVFITIEFINTTKVQKAHFTVLLY